MITGLIRGFKVSKIYRRDEWGAARDKGINTRISFPVERLMISNTGTSECASFVS